MNNLDITKTRTQIECPKLEVIRFNSEDIIATSLTPTLNADEHEMII